MVTFKLSERIVKHGDRDCRSYLYPKSKRQIIDKIKRLRGELKSAMKAQKYIQAIRLNATIERWQLLIDKDDSNQRKWEEKGK